MLIRLGYDIRFNTYARVPILAMLNVHPTREKDLLEPDLLRVEPDVPLSLTLIALAIAALALSLLRAGSGSLIRA